MHDLPPLIGLIILGTLSLVFGIFALYNLAAFSRRRKKFFKAYPALIKEIEAIEKDIENISTSQPIKNTLRHVASLLKGSVENMRVFYESKLPLAKRIVYGIFGGISLVAGAALLGTVLPMFYGVVTPLTNLLSQVLGYPTVKVAGHTAYLIPNKVASSLYAIGGSIAQAFKSKLAAFWSSPLTYVEIALALVGLGIGIASGKIELSYANRVVNQIKDIFYRLYTVPELRPKVTELILSHPKMPKDIKKAVMKLSKAYPRAG